MSWPNDLRYVFAAAIILYPLKFSPYPEVECSREMFSTKIELDAMIFWICKQIATRCVRWVYTRKSRRYDGAIANAFVDSYQPVTSYRQTRIAYRQLLYWQLAINSSIGNWQLIRRFSLVLVTISLI